MRTLARLVLRIWFREVEVCGAERIPPVQPRFLAKSTLWKIPILRPFLRLAGSIPVYRPQDKEDTSRNAETFTRAGEVLAQRGAIALFPEGKSHSQPGLQPLRTGAARIVLEAERKHPGLGVRIVPVGLLFDAKETF